MNKRKNVIKLPDDIATLAASLKDMRLLALARRYPKMSNETLCKKLGISELRLMKQIWRLRTMGLLHDIIVGYKRVFRVTIEEKMRQDEAIRRHVESANLKFLAIRR